MSDYAWAEHVDAATIAYVRGLDLREVGDVYRLDWSTERKATFDGAWDGIDIETNEQAVQLEERDGWVVVVEPLGFLTADDDVLTELSRKGEAVCVYWNVNARYKVALARDGVLVRSFDPYIQDWEPTGEPLTEEAGLPFGDEDVSHSALSLQLAERLTGIELSEDWVLETPHRTVTSAGPRYP
jgi:hypothetical protein